MMHATDQFTGPKPEGLPTMVGYQAAGAAPFLRGAPVKSRNRCNSDSYW